MKTLQRSFDDLGSALIETTFCIVDLETTGGAPGSSMITEIGAVKVRGGEVLGEFRTLVNPGCEIPPMITVLTGITNAMVIGAPNIEEALPAFLEFCGDAVVVAHNAAFDTRFLNYEAERLGYGRMENPVVCTVRLARRLVRDEVPNLRLETLAHALRARTPTHRALDDARATTDVLHALLELGGRWGVNHLEDLLWFQTAGGHPQAGKRKLADPLPGAPGVYMFRAADGALLYVGKATDLRTRVRSYFSSDDRRRIGNMLRDMNRIEHHETALEIEAAVLEGRLIRKHHPPYNRAGRGSTGKAWVRLTAERFPRIAIARTPGDGSIGPLSSAAATALREALEEAAPVRRCNDRIGAKTRFDPCALAQIGRCLAPCDGRVDPDAYAATLTPVRTALDGDPTVALLAIDERLGRLTAETRFEEAAGVRDRAGSLVHALARRRAADALRAAGRIVLDAGGVTVVIADGMLESAGGRALPAGADGHADETRLLWSWLTRRREIRLVSASGTFAMPVQGGHAIAGWQKRLHKARRSRDRTT
ncbi:MAG TPA: DEDD exonuclease domain-containing protein [Actinomycetota bacterium]|nr:DEDD exonuclease domain-containing protein [Actinomycetota bacterium]